MLRSPPRPTHIPIGKPVSTPTGITFDSPDLMEDTRAHHVHYHPSGVLIVKAFNNRTLNRVQAPPMLMLSTNFLLFHLSVATIEQLAPDRRRPGFGDHVIDLSAMAVHRLQIECHVGPKGAFDGPFQWPYGHAQLVVYRDAALYDVAYVAGEGAPIDSSVEHGGIKLKQTRITVVPTANIVEPSTLPNLSPEAWASPGAVARQLRTHLENCHVQLGQRLGHEAGNYEIKSSLCHDGVIVSVGWNTSSQTAQYSFTRCEHLGCEDVLGIVRQSRKESDIGATDVFKLAPELCGG